MGLPTVCSWMRTSDTERRENWSTLINYPIDLNLFIGHATPTVDLVMTNYIRVFLLPLFCLTLMRTQMTLVQFACTIKSIKFISAPVFSPFNDIQKQYMDSLE